MARTIFEVENGVEVIQVTEHPGIKSNIYCEIPWCSSDSRFFVYQQHGDDPRNPAEYVRCEFGSWKQEPLARGVVRSGPSIDPQGTCIDQQGTFYYVHRARRNLQHMVRVDLATGHSEPFWEFPEGFKNRGRIVVSGDNRYIVYGVHLGWDPQRFGIERVDRKTGETEIIHEDSFIWNPHTQLDPGKGNRVLIQHNRGAEFAPDGTRIRKHGPEGNTIFILEIETGDVTRLQLGRPHTPGTTGHEAWIGQTGEILVSVHAEDDYTPDKKGNLVAVRPDLPPRSVTNGYRFDHVGTSVCGRYYTCDDRPTKSIVIGSPHTGDSVFVCRTGASFGRTQPTHPHPYLSPDLKWVVFNSDRTGETQLHVARIPEAMIQSIQITKGGSINA